MAYASTSLRVAVSRITEFSAARPAWRSIWRSRVPCSPLSTLHSLSYLSRGLSRAPSFPNTALHQCVRQRWPVYSAVPVNSLTLCRHYAAEPSSQGGGEFKLVYTAPLKGAVRALKIFSLTTAVFASCGGPVLVWLGKESVPVAARLALCSLVVIVGLSTTALLHWLLKGYITHLHYQPETQRVAAYTLSLLVRRIRNEFEVTDLRPPTGLGGFSTFDALGKSYFMHTEVFPDKHLLSTLLSSKNNEQTKTE